MTEVAVRPATVDDRDAVAAICQRALLAIDRTDAAGLQRLLWETAGMTATVGTDGGAVVGAAFATVAEEPNGTRSGSITLLAVDPAHSGRGIGSALLGSVERRLADQGATDVWTGGGQPRFWWPGVDARSQDVLDFFRRHGYQPEDQAVNMQVDLTAADLTERPTGPTTIRRLSAAGWPTFRDWMRQTWEDPWANEVTTTLDREPVSCFLAERDGAIIGFAGYDTNRRGWFGPMGTSEAARGTGLGSELLRHCLRDYVDQGLQVCDIGWVGPTEFYAKTVGATLSRHFVRLRKGRVR